MTVPFVFFLFLLLKNSMQNDGTKKCAENQETHAFRPSFRYAYVRNGITM